MSHYIIFNRRNHTLKYSGGHHELESFITLEARLKAPGCVEKFLLPRQYFQISIAHVPDPPTSKGALVSAVLCQGW